MATRKKNTQAPAPAAETPRKRTRAALPQLSPLGKALRVHRIMAEMTQADMARQIGIKPSLLADIERGRALTPEIVERWPAGLATEAVAAEIDRMIDQAQARVRTLTDAKQSVLEKGEAETQDVAEPDPAE